MSRPSLTLMSYHQRKTENFSFQSRKASATSPEPRVFALRSLNVYKPTKCHSRDGRMIHQSGQCQHLVMIMLIRLSIFRKHHQHMLLQHLKKKTLTETSMNNIFIGHQEMYSTEIFSLLQEILSSDITSPQELLYMFLIRKTLLSQSTTLTL